AVTVDVPPLDAAAVRQALGAGRQRACQLRARGLIESCVLVCQGAWMAVDASVDDAAGAGADEQLRADPAHARECAGSALFA
ncbi:MAG: hypothetical protein M3Z15_01010, partial [Pseudomonadota bacterium]|nr:hypothetical protein [Pseudomonadota bacterium]